MHGRRFLSTRTASAGCFVATLFLSVSLAFAAGRDVGPFRGQVPTGWEISREAALTMLSAPDGACHVTVLDKRYDDGDLASLAKERAVVFGAKDVRSLGTGLGLVSENSAERYWFILVDGQYVEVSVSRACREPGPVLMSFTPAPGATKGLVKIAAALQTPQVRDWLTFQAEFPPASAPALASAPAPQKAGMPDFARYGGTPAHGEKVVGVTAALPTGWTRSAVGGWTILAAPDDGKWVAARVYPLKSDDYKAFLAAAKERARSLGGRNITASEGIVEFTTPEGHIGNMALYGKRCLLTLVPGDGEELVNVMASVSPEGN